MITRDADAKNLMGCFCLPLRRKVARFVAVHPIQCALGTAQATAVVGYHQEHQLRFGVQHLFCVIGQ